MKRNLIHPAVFIISLIVCQSCSNDSQVRYQKSTGKANELVIVISDDSWNGKPGELLRNTLAQQHVALPQPEPLFDVVNVPPSAFTKIFKTTRNIIQTTISSAITTPEVLMKDDVWSSPQATVEIKVNSAAQFGEIFNEYSNKILSYFLSAEKKRLTTSYEKNYEKTVYNALNTDFGVTMKVHPGFTIAEKKDNFIWCRYETPDISQGVILFTFPYVSDSTFTVNYLVTVCDSVVKNNVSSAIPGSYMNIEKRFDQVFNTLEHNKNYASEMRGLWRLQNDFMGGPYISLAELDASNQRVIVAFGFVYAPSKNKRNLLQQVEAMIYSLKLNNQDKNDKINSQVKMGN
jgi:hypothetical protein